MYDAVVRSTLFGLRNADKIANTNDKGRIFADVGQFTKAAQSAAKLDDTVGRGANAAIKAMGKITNKYQPLEKVAKGATWAANHVNPLLIGAAGYRVAIAKDKPRALKRETLGMTTMFMTEAAMKQFFESGYMTGLKAGMKNKHARTAISILEGVLFVMGSIASSTAGYKLGDKLFPKKEISAKNQEILNKALAELKSTESDNKQILA